jgi:hypothetical protein
MYKYFICLSNYSKEKEVALTKKGISFTKSPTCQITFEKLKKCFTSVLKLHHFDSGRKFVLEMDASNVVVTGIVSQLDNKGVLHPVAYFLSKHSLAEISYKIYEKELLVIIYTFKK